MACLCDVGDCMICGLRLVICIVGCTAYVLCVVCLMTRSTELAFVSAEPVSSPDYIFMLMFHSSALVADVPCTESMAPEEEHHITMNPMREFVHNIDDHTQNLFSKFVNTHARVYSGEDEHLLRMHTFRQHVRSVSTVAVLMLTLLAEATPHLFFPNDDDEAYNEVSLNCL